MKKYLLAIFLAILLVACGGEEFLDIEQQTQAVVIGDLYPYADGVRQWTTTSGNDHFALIDETGACNSTDYNYTNALNYYDTYNIPLTAVNNGHEITKVQCTPCLAKNGGINGSGTTRIALAHIWESGSPSTEINYNVTNTTPTNYADAQWNVSYTKQSGSILQIKVRHGGCIPAPGEWFCVVSGARISRLVCALTVN